MYSFSFYFYDFVYKHTGHDMIAVCLCFIKHCFISQMWTYHQDRFVLPNKMEKKITLITLLNLLFFFFLIGFCFYFCYIQIKYNSMIEEI